MFQNYHVEQRPVDAGPGRCGLVRLSFKSIVTMLPHDSRDSEDTSTSSPLVSRNDASESTPAPPD
jgi:hypothetical protein